MSKSAHIVQYISKSISRPPRPPPIISPSPSYASGISDYDAKDEGQVVPSRFRNGGTSVELRRLFDQFEHAPTFSQLNQRGDRGTRIITQHLGLLNHIWCYRDQTAATLCFDKHDRRSGTSIYNPPTRIAGGIVLPCSLVNEAGSDSRSRTVNVINNNITVQTIAGAVPNMTSSPPFLPPPVVEEVRGPRRKTKPIEKAKGKQKLQLTFAAPKHIEKAATTRSKDCKGRFIRKTLAPVSDTRQTAPGIPLSTRGLRRLLKQWVKGDEEKGLSILLAEFSIHQRNGKDATGKSNKALYSKRRTVAVATLLALQDAFENNKTFATAIGAAHTKKLESITMSQWERICKDFLRKGVRKLEGQEIIDLGKKIYREEVLLLLPYGDQ